MSSNGNRSNSNQTRVEGHHDTQGSQTHANASGQPDIGKQRGETHQETRDHNKHNNPGQSGHKPQQHGSAEEKR